MISKITKLSQEEADRISDLAPKNLMFIEQWIPQHSNPEQVRNVLKNPQDSWSILISDRPLAIFKLDIHEKKANVERFCPIQENAGSLENTISTMQNDLFKMGTTEIRIKVPTSITKQFVDSGFKHVNDFAGFSGKPIQMKMMPILRLSNATERDIPDLSKLLHQAYEGSAEKKFTSVASAEAALLEIMRGKDGRYVPDASFVSGILPNIVSACLITVEANMANVAELFTHPLYRARGLATTELAAAMNWLVKNNVEVLTAWVPRSNDVARRLFAKIGLKEDKQLAELVAMT